MESRLEVGKTGSREMVISVIWSLNEDADTGERAETEFKRSKGG